MVFQICLFGGAVFDFRFKRFHGLLCRSQLCDSDSLVADQLRARPCGDVPPSFNAKVY